jgi:hypothetical protein
MGLTKQLSFNNFVKENKKLIDSQAFLLKKESWEIACINYQIYLAEEKTKI